MTPTLKSIRLFKVLGRATNSNEALAVHSPASPHQIEVRLACNMQEVGWKQNEWTIILSGEHHRIFWESQVTANTDADVAEFGLEDADVSLTWFDEVALLSDWLTWDI